MAVITVSREFGNQGDAIALGLAKKLGYAIVDKALLLKLLGEYGMVDFERFYESSHSAFDRLDRENKDKVQILNQAIEAFAHQDKVIIQGRGGFAVMQGYADVLNVLVKAPFERRVAEIMRRQKLTFEAAEAITLQNDKARTSFLQTYYGVSTAETYSFDLMIDSSVVTVEAAIDALADLAAGLNSAERPGLQTTAEIRVDSVMDRSVKQLLGR